MKSNASDQSKRKENKYRERKKIATTLKYRNKIEVDKNTSSTFILYLNIIQKNKTFGML